MRQSVSYLLQRHHCWKLLTLFESPDPFLTAIIVWSKNVEVLVVIKHLYRHFILIMIEEILDLFLYTTLTVLYPEYTISLHYLWIEQFTVQAFFSFMNHQAHLKWVLIIAWYGDIATHDLHTLDSVQFNTTFHQGLFLKEDKLVFILNINSFHSIMKRLKYGASIQIAEFQIQNTLSEQTLTPGRRSEYFRSSVSSTKNLSLQLHGEVLFFC